MICSKIHENLIFPDHYTRPGPKDPRRLQILHLLLGGGADVNMRKVETLENGRGTTEFDTPLTYLYSESPVNVDESESNLAMLKLLLAFGGSYFCYFIKTITIFLKGE